MVVSFDTGPTWANWAAQFAAFKKRYPEVEIVVQRHRLGGHRRRARQGAQPPAGRHRVLLRGLGDRRRQQGRRRAVQAGQLRQAAAGVPRSGRQVVHHPFAHVAFVVNTKLVKNVPQSWADLLKPEYKNTVVYLDPRSTGVGQVLRVRGELRAWAAT